MLKVIYIYKIYIHVHLTCSITIHIHVHHIYDTYSKNTKTAYVI